MVRALVAAGIGVTTVPGLALAAHRGKGIRTTEIPGAERRIHAATYGDPPDPPDLPGARALVEALQKAAAELTAQ